MYHLIFLLFCCAPFARGLSPFGPTNVYKMVVEALFEDKVGEQCRRSLELFVENLENTNSDDQWAVQSEYLF